MGKCFSELWSRLAKAVFFPLLSLPPLLSPLHAGAFFHVAEWQCLSPECLTFVSLPFVERATGTGPQADLQGRA